MTTTTTTTTTRDEAYARLEAARAAYDHAREALRNAKAAAWNNRFNRNARDIVIDAFDAACLAYDAAEDEHAAAYAAYHAITDTH